MNPLRFYHMNTTGTPSKEPETTKSGRKKIVSTAKGTLTTMAMAILIITSILSLRGLPSEAKFGVQSIFYYVKRSAQNGDGQVCFLNGR